MSFRIGVHVGDVMVRGGDLFGEGVNIAARLESIAEPGALCVSGVAYDYVKQSVPFTFYDLGPQAVKNIDQPVRAYATRLGGTGRTVELKSLPLPDRPSIAVLPFANMSGDPEQEYFADGVVEEIVTALSHIKWLFVIAPTSSFTYKGRAVDLKQIGRELGAVTFLRARYVSSVIGSASLVSSSKRKPALIFGLIVLTANCLTSSSFKMRLRNEWSGPLSQAYAAPRSNAPAASRPRISTLTICIYGDSSS